MLYSYGVQYNSLLFRLTRLVAQAYCPLLKKQYSEISNTALFPLPCRREMAILNFPENL